LLDGVKSSGVLRPGENGVVSLRLGSWYPGITELVMSKLESALVVLASFITDNTLSFALSEMRNIHRQTFLKIQTN